MFHPDVVPVCSLIRSRSDWGLYLEQVCVNGIFCAKPKNVVSMHPFHGGNVQGGKQPRWNLPGGIFRGGICRSPKNITRKSSRNFCIFLHNPMYYNSYIIMHNIISYFTPLSQWSIEENGSTGWTGHIAYWLIESVNEYRRWAVPVVPETFLNDFSQYHNIYSQYRYYDLSI